MNRDDYGVFLKLMKELKHKGVVYHTIHIDQLIELVEAAMDDANKADLYSRKKFPDTTGQ